MDTILSPLMRIVTFQQHLQLWRIIQPDIEPDFDLFLVSSLDRGLLYLVRFIARAIIQGGISPPTPCCESSHIPGEPPAQSRGRRGVGCGKG